MYAPVNAMALHRRYTDVSIRPESWWSSLWRWRVKPGERLRIASREGKPGEKVVFDKVLLFGGDGAAKVGSPEVTGARGPRVLGAVYPA